MSTTRPMLFTALCAALGVVLPLAFHAIPNAGSIFLPMHIPVLICGLLCGFPYGLICGIVTPILSCLLAGSPTWAYIPSIVCELAMYGLISGILSTTIHTKSIIANIYISLIAAMLSGRVVYGVLNALIFRVGKYSLTLWLTAAFAKALPGIIIQLALIPAIIFALKKINIVRCNKCDSSPQ